MYRYYKKKTTRKAKPYGTRRFAFKRRYAYRKKGSLKSTMKPSKSYPVTPRLSVPPITVPIARKDAVLLDPGTAPNYIGTIFVPRPSLSSFPIYQRFGAIYNKFRVMKISINIIPKQMNAAYYNKRSVDNPMRYVVWRFTPDQIGIVADPLNYKEAMAMPGARSYSLNQSCYRTRLAYMGTIRQYLQSNTFDESGMVDVRQAVRAPWLSTSLGETDDPYLFGWGVWFPNIATDTPPNVGFEVENILHTRFINAMKPE